MKDHVYYIGSSLLYTPIDHHVNFEHVGNNAVIKFAALKRIVEDLRGGDFDKKILGREMQWIHNLKATTPPGPHQCDELQAFFVINT